MASTTKSYELLADSFNEVTSKPGEPLTYEPRVKGDKIKLTEARAKELIEAGAVVDPDAGDSTEKPGGETKAPKGRVRGSRTAPAPEPAGTGSTEGGDGGPAGDGQGSADGNRSSTGDDTSS